jgi:hypothetical protein
MKLEGRQRKPSSKQEALKDQPSGHDKIFSETIPLYSNADMRNREQPVRQTMEQHQEQRGGTKQQGDDDDEDEEGQEFGDEDEEGNAAAALDDEEEEEAEVEAEAEAITDNGHTMGDAPVAAVGLTGEGGSSSSGGGGEKKTVAKKVQLGAK